MLLQQIDIEPHCINFMHCVWPEDINSFFIYSCKENIPALYPKPEGISINTIRIVSAELAWNGNVQDRYHALLYLSTQLFP